LNLNPDLDYSLVETERGLLLLADSLVGKCMERYGLTGKVLATATSRSPSASRTRGRGSPA
jgi:isoleucyl-tRNA synthetase